MPRASSTSPLLRPPSRDVNPFNVWALTTFWGLQFIWMGLHIFLLTSGFLASNRIIQIFLVYVFLYCSYLINAFVLLPILSWLLYWISRTFPNNHPHPKFYSDFLDHNPIY